MTRSERAAATFAEGFSCSQAVFTAFTDGSGLDRETALKLSQSLGGGMAHLGEACGAVTGAFLAIGLRHGRTRAEDLAARDKTYALMTAFAGRFRARHGALRCPDLLGLDIGTEAGMAAARERDLFRTRCAALVRDAVEILEGLPPE